MLSTVNSDIKVIKNKNTKLNPIISGCEPVIPIEDFMV
jgi:hypothetical protein